MGGCDAVSASARTREKPKHSFLFLPSFVVSPMRLSGTAGGKWVPARLETMFAIPQNRSLVLSVGRPLVSFSSLAKEGKQVRRKPFISLPWQLVCRKKEQPVFCFFFFGGSRALKDVSFLISLDKTLSRFEWKPL